MNTDPDHPDRLRLARSSVAAFFTMIMVLAFVAVPQSPASAVPAGGMSADAVNSMFTTYGNAGNHWTGGDNTASVVLPDGRVAWLFADSFLGTVNADNTRPRNAPMVNNLIVVQDGTGLTKTLHGGTAQAPEALVKPTQQNEFFWAADGAVEGNTLKVAYNRMRKTGPGVLDFEQTGVSLATFALPSLTLSNVVDLPVGPSISWGAGIFPDGAYTYIYGISSGSGLMKFAHLARVPAGGLSGQWQYWTGSTWSTDVNAVGRLISGVGGGGVQKVGSQYVWVSHENNLMFDSQIVAYTSDSPTGPFAGPVQLFTTPEVSKPGVFMYNARVHPELARSGKLLVSYDLNSMETDGTYNDVRDGRPRFIEVDWPRPAPSPNVPAAPTGLTVTVHEDLAVLKWQAVAGATAYWVHQRDVTGGQTHFARVPTSTTALQKEAAFLFDGHTYEYKVTASNASGAGPFSGTVSATIDVAPPVAPTGVTAAADTSGGATISWNPVPNVWGYTVLARDITLGEIDFTTDGQPEAGSTQYRADKLVNGHEYEFVVKAKNGGGDSPQSAGARATAFYALPPAVTGLKATLKSDGSIQLDWDETAPGLWYQVYQRDATAGDTDFTRLPYPATSNTMTAGYLQHGHVYEYKVAAINEGGEGPTSPVVSATSTIAPPPAPTGLTATPAADGTIELKWATSDPDLWHLIYQRDLTAGETEFTPWEWPVTECCQKTAGMLKHSHVYEYKVVAINGGGESGSSNVARATATLPLANAPTNLQATPGDRRVTLTWTSPEPGSWHWIYMRDATDGGDWSRLELPVTTCCSFTALELTNGHNYQFRAAVIGADGAPDSAQSNIASATPAGLAPDAPGNLTATAGNSQVTLKWEPSVTAGAWYWVWMRNATAGQAWHKLELPITNCCTFTSGSLTNGQRYEYKVVTIGAGGGPDSAASNVAGATPTAPAPGAPTNLTATAGNGQAVLKWTASSTSGAWYWVWMRDATAGQAWQKLSLPITNCCTFTSTDLVNGHRYEYRVNTVGANGGPDSGFSNVDDATPVAPRPAPPTGLNVVSGNGKASLTWTASHSGAWYWVWMRNVSAGQSWQKLELPITNCCSFTSTGLTNGDRYDYRVTTVGSGGAADSVASNVDSAYPVAPTPGAPSGLNAVPGNGKVTLTWNASSTSGAWYWIWSRNVSAGQSWKKNPTPVNSCCTYVASYLTNKSKYEFRVQAIGTGGAPDSGFSNVREATPVAPRPAPPTNLKATITSTGITLNWTASTTPGAWYWIERRNTPINTSWSRYEWPDNSCCNFTATMLGHGTQQFRVLTIGSGGAEDSVPSNVVTVDYTPPTIPTNLRYRYTTSQGARAIALSWNASRNATTYVIEARNRTRNGSWYKTGETTSRSFVFECPGTDMFEFRVYAKNTVGASWYSNNVMMLGDNEGWQRYSPRQTGLWNKYSGWYYGGPTSEECPIQGEYCYRQVQFQSKGLEYYWRHGNYGQIERSWLATGINYHYRSCLSIPNMCSSPTDWAWAMIPGRCSAKQPQFGWLVGIDPWTCFSWRWKP
ncbi:fibronectin type III domain-containing protein [Actinoplanes sp. NPDC023801]|uniref:fibronectin type III domain-containing protein n=1 Tax=Actinoplanes sp. NPDC023801 TaxID=3154595 RepID=UPI0033FC67C8